MSRPIAVDDLVVTTDGYFALVRDVGPHVVRILQSNGLDCIVGLGKVRPLPLKFVGITSSNDAPASFAEAFRALRARVEALEAEVERLRADNAVLNPHESPLNPS